MTLDQIKFFFDNLKETLESIITNGKCFIFGDLNYNLFRHHNKWLTIYWTLCQITHFVH